MCANHPIPERAALSVKPPDLAPIPTAMPDDAGRFADEGKARAEKCKAAVEGSSLFKDGKVRFVYADVGPSGTPFLTAQADGFCQKCEDAFDNTLEKCLQTEFHCRPCHMTEIRVLKVRPFGWVGYFTINLETEDRP